MYVDTHTHIYMAEFPDPAAEIRKAVEAGVTRLVFPGTEPSDFEPRKALAERFPGTVFLGAGDTSRRDEQIRVFRRQCELALDLDLPVIIHCREGLSEVLEVLSSLPAIPRNVFHSFTGTADDVARIREISPDSFFGINGIVTFKNAKIRNVLPEIGLDRILLETDAPWLAPVPHRGKQNTSAYIPDIARHIAESTGIPLETVAETTTRNALQLFGL